MQVVCPTCSTTHTVPADKVGVPGLRCRCRCGNSFPVQAAPAPPQEIRLAPITPPPPPAQPPSTAAATPPRTAVPAAVPKAPAVAARSAERPLPGPAWRRCSQHPSQHSSCVCRTCGKGFCSACERRVREALICPACDRLCVPASTYLAVQQREQERARSLFAEVKSIVSYPLVDPLGYVLLALFTGAFALMARFALFGGALAVLLSSGVLTLYAFSAANRVSRGDRQGYMPDVSDIGDIAAALRLAGAALAISLLPLLAVLWFLPPEPAEVALEAAPAVQTPAETPALLLEAEPEPEPEPGDAEAEAEQPAPAPSEPAPPEPSGPAGAVRWAAFLAALLWALAYGPVALTVAVVSRSVLQTLNPVLGVATILRMGSTYWQAATIYSAIALAAGTAAVLLGLVPLVGWALRPFVDAYAYLMVGCLLGLAIDKRARELDLED